MNAPFPTPAAGMTEDRRLLIEAMIALVDAALVPKDGTFPGQAARRLTCRLLDAGLATRTEDPSAETLTLMGITARASGSAYALLTAWKQAARRRIEQT